MAHAAVSPAWLKKDSLSQALVKEVSKGERPTISIAAAGNSGFNFPFAPAIWDSVLSVSAGDAGQKPAAYSNWGEVVASGVHPMATAVVGTSFAAPRMSLAAAFYLLDLDELTASCGTASPPLKTAATKPECPWRNLDVPAAIAATSSTTTPCSGFPTPMPWHD